MMAASPGAVGAMEPVGAGPGTPESTYTLPLNARTVSVTLFPRPRVVSQCATTSRPSERKAMPETCGSKPGGRSSIFVQFGCTVAGTVAAWLGTHRHAARAHAAGRGRRAGPVMGISGMRDVPVIYRQPPVRAPEAGDYRTGPTRFQPERAAKGGRSGKVP